MDIVDETNARFSTVEYYLSRLEDASYRMPLDILSGSSIGEHTRHITEFYQCLFLQLPGGIIDYDLRERKTQLQENVQQALYAITGIREWLCSPEASDDRILTLAHHTSSGNTVEVMTSLQRELIYNLEHLIHHLALIKIGLKILCPDLELPESFGVAASTLKFRNRGAVAS